MGHVFAPYSTVLNGTLRYSTVLNGTLRYSTVLNGTLRYSTVLYGTLRYSTVLNHRLHPRSLLIYYGNRRASQVQRLRKGWTERVSNPGGDERYSLLNIRPDSHWGSPSLLYYGYPGSFLGVQRPERVVTTHPLLVTGLKKGTPLYVPSPLCLHGILRGELHIYSSIS